MRKLVYLLCPLLALGLLAQERADDSDSMKSHVKELKLTAEKAKEMMEAMRAVALRPGLCSIPLLEVPIPPGTKFSMQVIPEPGKTVPIPQGGGPAPSCSAASAPVAQFTWKPIAPKPVK
jgi:hypothetical protein